MGYALRETLQGAHARCLGEDFLLPGLFLMFPGAGQDLFHSLESHRLGQPVKSPGPERPCGHADLRRTCQHAADNGRRHETYLLKKPDPVHARQPHVEEGHVRGLLSDEAKRCFRIRGTAHGIPPQAETIGQETGKRRFIVHEQNVHASPPAIGKSGLRKNFSPGEHEPERTAPLCCGLPKGYFLSFMRSFSRITSRAESKSPPSAMAAAT